MTTEDILREAQQRVEDIRSSASTRDYVTATSRERALHTWALNEIAFGFLRPSDLARIALQTHQIPFKRQSA